MTCYLFTIFGLCLIFAISTDGLECFDCLYLDTKYHHEDIKIEESCASGQTPLARLSFDCSSMEYRMLPNMEGVALGMSSSNLPLSANSQRLPPLPNAVFTCATLTYDGKYNSIYDRLPVVGVYRTCLMSFQNRTIDEGCHHGKLKDLIATVKQEELLDLLVDFSDELDENVTDTSIFNCNGNNCNAETGGSAGLISEIGIVTVFAIIVGIQGSI